MKSGEIYLVDFGERYQSNLGKVRPAIVFCADGYLEILPDLSFPSVPVIPLTTQLVQNPANLFRVSIPAADRLEKPSEAIVNWICSVDAANIDQTNGPLTRLSESQMRELQNKFAKFMGLSPL